MAVATLVKTEPIIAAAWTRNAQGTPCACAYGDAYHPANGPFEQAQHVFLRGNGLPERFARARRFVILETGFGLGNNFLATWYAWRQHAARDAVLHFISIEKHPLTRNDLREVHRATPHPELAAALIDAWPPLVHNLHRLSFDEGGIQLSLAFGDVAAWLPELVARVDAFYLDGYAPSKNPQMWQAALFKALARLAAPGATAATWSSARVVRDGLHAAGFVVERVAGLHGKRDVTYARYAPPFTPRRAPSRWAATAPGGRVAIVGAGLAGASVAWALAQHGIASTVFDSHQQPAQGACGNPAGIFHGIVHADDGTHARGLRAASLAAAHTLRSAIADGVPGHVAGLLRLQINDADVASMRAILHRLGLPADYAQALDVEAASSCAGVALPHAAWFMPAGGWVDPSALVRWFLRRHAIEFRGGVHVHGLQRSAASWQLLDADHRKLHETDTVVLANAGDLPQLLPRPICKLEQVRGQWSMLPAGIGCRPTLPIAGSGYAIPLPDGRLMFGATAQPSDDDAGVREHDHAQNVAQLSVLLGTIAADPSTLTGRTAWRSTTPDRLPLIGAVPELDGLRGTDRPNRIERIPGLYVFAGLGSRGITWAPLGAQVLSALISGAPVPLEASLLDAVDPARFALRDRRRAESR